MSQVGEFFFTAVLKLFGPASVEHVIPICGSGVSTAAEKCKQSQTKFLQKSLSMTLQ